MDNYEIIRLNGLIEEHEFYFIFRTIAIAAYCIYFYCTMRRYYGLISPPMRKILVTFMICSIIKQVFDISIIIYTKGQVKDYDEKGQTL